MTDYKDVEREKDYEPITDYKEYLKSSEWKERSERIKERDKHMCQEPGCGAKTTLEVHHMFYPKRLGDELDKHLITLCKKHHAQRYESFVDMTLADPYVICKDKGNEQGELELKYPSGHAETIPIIKGFTNIKHMVDAYESIFKSNQKKTCIKYCVERNVTKGRLTSDMPKIHLRFKEWQKYYDQFLTWLLKEKNIGDIVTNYDFRALFPKKSNVDLAVMDYLVCQGYLKRKLQLKKSEALSKKDRDIFVLERHVQTDKTDKLTGEVMYDDKSNAIQTQKQGSKYELISKTPNPCPLLKNKDIFAKRCKSCNTSYRVDVDICQNKKCNGQKLTIHRSIQICNMDYEYGRNWHIIDRDTGIVLNNKLAGYGDLYEGKI
jgi:hypothetical protein